MSYPNLKSGDFVILKKLRYSLDEELRDKDEATTTIVGVFLSIDYILNSPVYLIRYTRYNWKDQVVSIEIYFGPEEFTPWELNELLKKK